MELVKNFNLAIIHIDRILMKNNPTIQNTLILKQMSTIQRAQYFSSKQMWPNQVLISIQSG